MSPPEDQWDRNAESYELFRRIWRNDKVTASPRVPAGPAPDAEVWPRPFQQPIRVWHGSATSRESVDLAARYGDPLFSANVTNPIQPYAELIRYYRERWEFYGHDPALAAVGAGTAGFYAARHLAAGAAQTTRPVFAGHLAMVRSGWACEPVFPTLEDFVERSSALIGSPQQIIEKVHRYHEQFGHTCPASAGRAGGLTCGQHRASLELFQSDIAPVLRREIPDPPWDWESGPGPNPAASPKTNQCSHLIPPREGASDPWPTRLSRVLDLVPDQLRLHRRASPAQQHRPRAADRALRLHALLVRRAPPQPRRGRHRPRPWCWR